ncbi:PAS domain S-box protein [Psychromonas sp. KJ10-10]|uniref:PAS domain S-box protein n=1 Tax=Psychromonas sp. KJ10-10 TaxID=3391823 RepID=UPI0039B5006A
MSSFKFAINPESSECSSVLSEILKLNNNYINLGIPGVDGDLLCNAKMSDKTVNVADRSYFQQAIRNKDFSIGQFQVDRVTGIISINFAYPVINPENDEIVGVSVAVVSLEWWSKYLAESRLPFNSVAYITDHEDKIIVAYPDNTELLGTKLVNEEVNKVPLTAGLLPFGQPTEHSRMFASRPLFDNSELINISVGIPLDEELQTINKRLLNIAGWLFIGMLVIFLIANWAIRKSLLKPLKGLLHFAKELELGKEIPTIPLQGSSELIELQKRFNSMAKTRLLAEQQLKSSESSLRESKNRLKNHIENTPLGCISWDKDFNCTDWNHSAEKIFGYHEDEALGGQAWFFDYCTGIKAPNKDCILFSF